MSKPNYGQYTGTILDVTHKGTSTMGNPTYEVLFESNGQGVDYLPGARFRTQSNASIGYSITNYKRGQKVTVFLTPAGKIFNAELVA